MTEHELNEIFGLFREKLPRDWKKRQHIASLWGQFDEFSDPEMLEQLAADRDSIVRLEVARNRNTPVEILRRLLKDEKRSVRQAAQNNMRLRRLGESLLREYVRECLLRG